MRLSVPVAPPRRSRKRPWREAEFVALDFETTGLDLRKDAVVSFGVVPVVGGRVQVGRGIHQLVVPAVPSSPASMKIHHILPRDLTDAPSLDEARAMLRTALDGRYLLAWYADVEVSFLGRIFGGGRRSWLRRTIDARRLVIELEHAHPEARFSLSSTAERYHIPVASPHEAFDDALVTAQLFLVLASRLESRGSGSVADLLGLTRR